MRDATNKLIQISSGFTVAAVLMRIHMKLLHGSYVSLYDSSVSVHVRKLPSSSTQQ
jgi:hypothetical protein